MAGALSSDWKSDIISDDPDEDETLLELKGDIVNLVTEGTNSLDGIKSELDHEDALVENLVEELKDEDVLEVVG